MVEAMAICPVYYGRFNLTSDPAEFLRRQKEHAVPVAQYDEGATRVRDKYPVGLLHHTEREEFVTALGQVNERAREAAHG